MNYDIIAHLTCSHSQRSLATSYDAFSALNVTRFIAISFVTSEMESTIGSLVHEIAPHQWHQSIACFLFT